ncbi:MAG TPA: DUF2933 domain-containing protein [Burkholderiales bacterium]|nr:DUF2933 domain-containing protein [Burkholderiales bacterium]
MAEHSHENRTRGGDRGRWVFRGFLLIAGYFLVTEHLAHTIEFLPIVLLLACPLLHLFHHARGGHGGHGGDESERRDPR